MNESRYILHNIWLIAAQCDLLTTYFFNFLLFLLVEAFSIEYLFTAMYAYTSLG